MYSDLSYCGQLVKQQDPDRFLLSMFAPADRREALWALFAFNHEIAKTREVVSETQLGLIRLQWWREAIGEIYPPSPDGFGETSAGAAVRQNEILPALAEVIKRYELPQEHFEMLLHAREFDLEDVLPGNLEGLLNYVDFTHTPLVKLASQILGADINAEPLQPLAMNYALIGLLRAIPFHASQRRCYLPEDLMSQHSVRTNNLYEGKVDEGLQPVIQTVADEIILDLRLENKFLKTMQKLVKIYTGQLRNLRYDAFSPKLQGPPAFKTLRLFF